MKHRRFTAALSAVLIATTGATFAQAPAAPVPATPVTPALDLSKLMTPENLAALSALLKQGQGEAAAPDLNGALKSLGESPEIQKLLTPENLAALGALLQPPPAPAPAPAPAPPAPPAPAPAPDFGGLLKSLGENPEIQKLMSPENLAALGAMLEPMLKDLNVEGLLQSPPAGEGCPLAKCKFMIVGPDGVAKEFNAGDLQQLFKGHHHHQHGAPAQPAPAPQVAPEPQPAPDAEAARKARIEALIEQLRQELLK